MMRHLAILALVLSSAFADDSAYRAGLESAHQRFAALERQATSSDFTPAEAEERCRLLGQLITDDPVWALRRQLEADTAALAAASPKNPADTATLEILTKLLLVTIECEHRPTTRPEAEVFATVLRQFIVRRDVAGATAWAKAQNKPGT